MPDVEGERPVGESPQPPQMTMDKQPYRQPDAAHGNGAAEEKPEATTAPVVGAEPKQDTASQPAPVGFDSLLRRTQLPSFDREDILQPTDFDSAAFVRDVKKRNPALTTEDFLAQLKKQLGALQEELMELINRDYNDFVSLTANLRGVDDDIDDLETPLQKMKENIGVVRSSIFKSLRTVKEKIHARREVIKRKTQLQMLQNVNNSITKIEKLLNEGNSVEIESSTQAGADDTDTTSGLIERVAFEFNQLKFNLSKAPDLPFRISKIEGIMFERLEGFFVSGIAERDTERIQQCLRAYLAIDRVEETEDYVSESILRPLVHQIVTPEKLTLGEPSSTRGLEDIYKELITVLKSNCGPLLEVTQKHASSVQSFDFFTRCMWKEVSTRISKEIPIIWTPGLPDQFQKNLLLTLRFLEDFESLCLSQSAVAKFRQHDSYSDFLKRWQTGVYYRIRLKDIAGKLEGEISKHSTSGDKSDGPRESGYYLSVTEQAWKCILQTWSPQVYVPTLAGNFLKLTFQILRRYQSWIEESASKIAEQNEQPRSAVGGMEALSSSQLQGVRLYRDVDKLASELSTRVVNEIIAANPTALNPPMEVAWMDVGVSDACEQLRQLLPNISKAVTSAITAQCSESLKAGVKGIPPSYRMSSKDVASQPSRFMEGVLQPLRQFLDDQAGLGDETRRVWSKTVIDDVTTKYAELISESLSTERKMEDSLKKLKRGHGAGFVDKIVRQFALDVDEYGSGLAEFGIELATFSPFIALKATLEPPAQT